MRTLAFWAAVLALLGQASPARSESIYRYRDPNTKREVFVTRLDQVPAEYREQANLVVADGVLVDSANQADQNAPRGTVIYESKNRGGFCETIKRAFRDASGSGLDIAGLYRLGILFHKRGIHVTQATPTGCGFFQRSVCRAMGPSAQLALRDDKTACLVSGMSDG